MSWPSLTPTIPIRTEWSLTRAPSCARPNSRTATPKESTTSSKHIGQQAIRALTAIEQEQPGYRDAAALLKTAQQKLRGTADVRTELPHHCH